MADRWVIYAEKVDEIDYDPLLDHLADDVQRDMTRLAPVDTGALKAGTYVVPAYNGVVRVASSRDVPGDDPKVPFYVEEGTSKMCAQPYMRPALFRYRPGTGQTIEARP